MLHLLAETHVSLAGRSVKAAVVVAAVARRSASKSEVEPEQTGRRLDLLLLHLLSLTINFLLLLVHLGPALAVLRIPPRNSLDPKAGVPLRGIGLSLRSPS